MTAFRPALFITFFSVCASMPAESLAAPGSVELFVNDANNGGSTAYDYGDQTNIPLGFGEGEFTLELWIRPNDTFLVGPVGGGANQRENWSNVDNVPYSSGTWWFSGNFLLDGHNNAAGSQGTFDLQFYGGGRVRWLFGDGSTASGTDFWSVGAYPAANTPSLLDGAWHQITLVRRWIGGTGALLELWVDGSLVDTETTPVRTDMRQWWTAWPGFPTGQEGWFWGAEKQAALGEINQFEDYKGLIDELRFWSRAKSADEITNNYTAAVAGNEPGLVGWYDFGEGMGSDVCDMLDGSRCIFLQNQKAGVWSPQDAPVTGGGDSTAPSVPDNLQGMAVSDTRIDLTWSASSDNVAVAAYDVRRDGVIVGSPSGTSFSDTGLVANTGYQYTVSARDGAGNASAESAAVMVSTLVVADTQAPTTPAGVQVTTVSATQVTLSWTASTDDVAVVTYEIRRDGVVAGSSTTTSFTDSGLTANTSYAYDVSAGDAAGNQSAPSSAINVTTDVGTSPPPSGGGGGGGGGGGAANLAVLLLLLTWLGLRRKFVTLLP